MLLPRNYNNGYKDIAKEILQKRWIESKYLIVDWEHFNSNIDRSKFKYSLELLDLLGFFNRINEMYKGLSINKEIKVDILFEAIQHIQKEKPFSDAQLKRYYQLWQEFEEVMDSMHKLIDYDDYYVSYEISFILLGSTYENIYEASRDDDSFGNLHEAYGELASNTRFKKLEIDQFIKEAREVLEPINKPAELVK